MLIKQSTFIRSLIFMVLYFALSVYTFFTVKSGLHLMLGWNILLAFLPFLFIYLFDHKIFPKKWVSVILLVLWLLFYPNAIYLITDYIYIDSSDFMISLGDGQLVYQTDYEAYLSLFHIATGMILGFYYGMTSLSVLMYYVKESKFRKYQHGILATVTVLSGFAIYVGRFFRYNSWDFIRFWVILKDLVLAIDWFMVFFVCIMTLIQLLFYYLFMQEKSPS